MKLTYHDVMTADLSALTSTAKKWRSMAEGCDTLRDNYRDHVRGRLKGWVGESANAFWLSSGTTMHEFNGAEWQARKIAGLLDDAVTNLTKARELLKKVRDQAIDEGGMKVDDDGRCTLKTRNNNPGAMDAENAWNRRILAAVKHVDDVDYEVMLSLKAAARDDDGKGEANGFNSKAIGDVDTYAAKRSAELLNRLDSTKDDGGLGAKGRQELEVLVRANADDKHFSRTMLASVGPDGLIDASNQLNALAHGTDTGNRHQYQSMQGHLATSLATATKVPEFRGDNGKKLSVGSQEYGKKYRSWLNSKDGAFYAGWRDDMQRAGAKKWTVTSDRPAGTAPESGYSGRGYQSLITLMEHGDGYSPQMLHDLGDDIRAAEDKDPNIWDRRGSYGLGEGPGGPGQFQNDPYDGVLGIMAKDPETAASYLDPDSYPNPAEGENSPAGEDGRNNDRLEYLVERRDWKIVDEFGVDSTNHSDKIDKNAHDGFEAALKAGATGRLPDALTGPDHSAANAGVMEEAVRVFGGEGDGVPPIAKDQDFAGFRGTLGEMIADYPGDVQREFTGSDKYPLQGHQAKFGNGSLHEFLNQVGRDPHGYGVVKASQEMYTVDYLRNEIQSMGSGGYGELDWSDARGHAQNAVEGGSYAAGVLSEAKADALFEEKVDSAREFNEKAENTSKWVNRFVGLGTGSIGTGAEGPGATLSTPIAWAQEDVAAAVMEHVKADVPGEAGEGEVKGRHDFTQSKDAGKEFYKRSADVMSGDAGLERNVHEGVVDGARTRAGSSFQEGADAARSHGSAVPEK